MAASKTNTPESPAVRVTVRPPREWLEVPDEFGTHANPRWLYDQALGEPQKVQLELKERVRPKARKVDKLNTEPAVLRSAVRAAHTQHRFFVGLTRQLSATTGRPIANRRLAHELGWNENRVSQLSNGTQVAAFADYLEIIEAVHRLNDAAPDFSALLPPARAITDLDPDLFLGEENTQTTARSDADYDIVIALPKHD